MRATVLSESRADEAAYQVLVEAILGSGPIDWAPGLKAREGGWRAALGQLPATIKHLHYQTGVELLVVVVDSDSMPERTAAGGGWQHDRLSQMRASADAALAGLRPAAGRATLRVAVGLAVPTIEGWLLCGRHPHASEAAFVQEHWQLRHRHLRLRLKREVYGTEAPDLQTQTRIACEEAGRLAARLDLLRRDFPFGFGALESDLRAS